MAEILLDAGTNEVEILAFELGGRRFGVNVAKVREVIGHCATIDVPNKHKSVIGMFNVRGRVLTLIDLAAHLGIRSDTVQCSRQLDDSDERSIIITEFNEMQLGFLIDGVDRIYRLSWSKVLPMPRIRPGRNDHAGLTTGLVALDNDLLLLVDFESIADSILNDDQLSVGHVDNPLGVNRSDKRVIVVDDSAFMRKQIQRAMLGSGYTQLETYENGLDAWKAIDRGGVPIDAIISDIEMPCMDGLHLTRRIKSDRRFADVPVILFSSLISADNAKKGISVGAMAQLPKPKLADVVRIVDRIVSNRSIDDIISVERAA